MTLAVALRQALAGVLGISTAELGYSVRPVRLEDGQSVSCGDRLLGTVVRPLP